MLEPYIEKSSIISETIAEKERNFFTRKFLLNCYKNEAPGTSFWKRLSKCFSLIKKVETSISGMARPK
jgi:hypothetical protein